MNMKNPYNMKIYFIGLILILLLFVIILLVSLPKEKTTFNKICINDDFINNLYYTLKEKGYTVELTFFINLNKLKINIYKEK